MNAYHNSWPEEQQHLQRQKDLIHEAERRRLVRLVRQAGGENAWAARAPRFRWAWLRSIRCRLSTLFEHLTSRTRPAAVSSDCP